ncbi:FAD/NAD(P)-binding domain-containing protein [Fistulina hepatica ATCC 64428]|uniref:FAD/NAD(P)-binding domain-containing protein n=1 Tax=Fistulina hepatica ATCC 64428 TaxID=1128425 RepID=A0A0D7A8Q3_9AGAR|nr:FAD/NAD(P)-binding domain-containing protein [Fistulina hepatica ATCC 64428]
MTTIVDDCRVAPIGIIGAGAAGLITAHVLLQDGFQDVHIVTRDAQPGGVWAPTRVYPGLFINNVHGEYRFSPFKMAPVVSGRSDSHLSGDDMCAYMSAFSDKFLGAAQFHYRTEVKRVVRRTDGAWVVSVEDQALGESRELFFSKIVLCTGGCSEPTMPKDLSQDTATRSGFTGKVLHSSRFRERLDEIGGCDPSASVDDLRAAFGRVVIVGGGKSALDVAKYLAYRDIPVSVVFEKVNAFVAAPFTLPAFIRKSRLLSLLSPHIHLRTQLERFLHQTWLGANFVRWFWATLQSLSFNAASIPKDSPLRNVHSLFWQIRIDDEGKVTPDSFYSLVNAGKIQLTAPARAVRFYEGGLIVREHDKQRQVPCDTVVLATGYCSSWRGLFDEETASEIGIGRRVPYAWDGRDEWNSYRTLDNPPEPRDIGSHHLMSSIYRGLVPARNIERRDFAVNGAVFSTNNGYSWEVAAHWISSYFLGDPFLRVPALEEASAEAEREAEWMRRRFPETLRWVNESYSAGIAFFTYPQAADDLLEDMGLPAMRSGGNWLTWPFKVIDLNEIMMLKEERDAKRREYASAEEKERNEEKEKADM